MTALSSAELQDLKDRNPCDQVARRWVALRKNGRAMVGPCPICSLDPAKRSSTRFEATEDGWVCAACSNGGDVIKLVMLHEEIDFLAAVAWLGGAQKIDPEVEAIRAAELAAKNAKRENDNAFYREKERKELWQIWNHAVPAAGSPVEDYLRLRGLTLPPGCRRLKCVPSMPYFNHGGSDAQVIARAPAMLAPIIREHKFTGLHFTYLDLSQPKGKARIRDPETGDELPPKKVRGSKTGGLIELVRVADPLQLIMGEGIETVLAVWRALEWSGQDLARTAFASAIDLGNLGGKATGTIAHPTLTTEAGRPRRVAGPDPDLTSPAIVIPPSVEDVVLLGDGDSDRVLTECALYRAQVRLEGPSRRVRAAFAPEGRDFNDMLG